MANKNGLEKITETLGKIDPTFKTVLNENVEVKPREKTTLDLILENVSKIENIHKRSLNENNLYLGAKVKISDGSGVDSNKTGVIVSPKEVKTSGNGIPTNIQGAYKPVDWNNEVAVRLDDGELITMFKNRLSTL